MNPRIINAIIKGIAGYLSLVLFFGIIFFLTDSLAANSNSNPHLHFFDYLYFSLVTFSTIGYGEIIPSGISGKTIVFVESCIGLAFTPTFGGYLAYLFIQRPKDFFLSENIFLRSINNKIFLSARVGNKGRPIVGCEATIEMFQVEDNLKRTLFKHVFSRPIVEITWYINLRLDDAENRIPLQHLKTVLANPDTCMIRITFSGQDATSGNLVHLFQYYKVRDLKRGGKFLDVYSWQGVQRIMINWHHFNRTEPIADELNDEIDKLLGR